MALITCLECGEEISEKAPACPKCGHPMEVFESSSQKGTTKATSLTKPAGCFLQCISPFIFLVGLGLLVSKSYFSGGLLAALGAWLFILGGKPARQK